MDEWVVAVCSPKLLKRHGRLRGPGDTRDYPLLQGVFLIITFAVMRFKKTTA